MKRIGKFLGVRYDWRRATWPRVRAAVVESLPCWPRRRQGKGL